MEQWAARNWPRVVVMAFGLVIDQFPGSAVAGDAGRISLIEENDAFASKDDRHYTQGANLSYLSGNITPGGAWDQPFNRLDEWLPILEGTGAHQRKIQWSVGQSIFTPEDLRRSNPDPTDRPYAGWLYTGGDLLQDQDGRALEDLELLLGMVGPGSLAGEAQNAWHSSNGFGEVHGWSRQLHTEPGLVLSYERKWRFEQPLPANLAVDAVPELGASLGNVLTYGEAGGILRFGQNLGADYGPARIRPALSGGGWFDADKMSMPVGWYFFLGAEGRAVGRNIFLDGNTWQSSRSVDKKPLVTDIVYGASLFWTDKVRVDFAVTERSKEFYGQHFTDRFGTITLACLFW